MVMLPTLRRWVITTAILSGVVGVPASALNAEGVPASQAQSSAILFATAQRGEVLIAIDVNERTTTAVGRTGLPPGTLALAIPPDVNGAYSISSTQNAQAAQLSWIDLTTGAGELAVSRPVSQDLYVMGMTFSRDGLLYAAGDYSPMSPTFNSLYVVDLEFGQADRVGALNSGTMQSDFIMSFSVDSAGTLYGASMMALYTIDTATAAATQVVDFVGAATNPSRVMGIAFDKNDQLYVADFVDLPQGGSTIYTLDLETGVLTPVVQTGFAFVHNIAFMPDHAPIAREDG